MPKSTDLDDLHATALAQFKFIAEIETPQRDRELEALNFQAGKCWTADAILSRKGIDASGAQPAVPARPMLTMRTLDQPIAQIVNQEHDADLAITITAKDGKANKDTAEVIAGLVRAIQNDSHADDVYSWGFQRMVGCGRGYWRVNKDYANDQEGEDQVIRIAPIENGFSVYLDPLPTWQPNGGFWEPEYGFITQDIPASEYRRQFGESKLAHASDSEALTSMGDNHDHWVIESETADGKAGGKFYRIAEYWYAVYTKKTVGEREIQVRTIKWAKMNGVEWLDEPQEWDGRFIPIIEDSGNQYNVGGEVIYEGMVQPAISPCRMLNFMVSAAAEKIGLSTLSPWLVAAGQLQGYEAWWNQSNTRNFPFLEYNAVTAATGPNQLPPPQRNNDDPNISAYGEMIALFTNFIRGSTGVPDAALGNVNPNDRSGKAIEELKIASQQGTSGWLTHHARAIRHTGIVVVDMIPKIYDRPGRVERIIGKDKAEDWVALNAPFVKGPDGQPQPPPQPGLMQRGMQALGMGGKPGPEPQMFDLKNGQYGVIVNVGKSAQTLKAETFAGMNALAQAAPELVPRFADLWVESMDIPQAEAIAARIKPPGVGEDGEPDPQQLMAENQQLKAAMQELQQLADDNQAKVKIAEMKAQTDMAKAQQDAQLTAMTTQAQEQSKSQQLAQSDHVKLEIAALQAQTQIAIAEIKAGQEETKNAVQLMLKKMDLAHDTHMHVQAQQDAQTGKVLDHEIGEHSAEREHERARDLQSREHEQELMTSQIPPPKDPNKQPKA